MKKGNMIFKMFLGLMAVIFLLGVSAFPAQAVVVFSEDFDPCSGDWYADNGIWECGIPTYGPSGAHSGTNVFGTVLSGNYPDYTDSRLVSPSIILPAINTAAGEELHLKFWQWFSLWAQTFQGYYDIGRVQISEETSPGVWSAWTDIGGVSLSSGVWTNANIDISAYAGKKVRIGFMLDNYGPGTTPGVAAGWYIDDVEITGTLQTYYCDNDIDGYISSAPRGTCTRTGCVPAGCQTVAGNDCDDNDPKEHPNQTWYKDTDNDLYSDGTTNTTSCTRPAGYKVASELTATSGDCNDNNANIRPGVPEVCGNGVDDNCNSQIDEGCQAGADLIISSLSGPLTGGAGKNITVTDITKNQGTGTAGPSTTKLYFSTDATYSAEDKLLGSRAVSSLSAGATSTGSTNVTIPSVTCADTYYIIAIADAENAVSETNENNNAKNKSIKIGSDLIVSSVSAPLSAAAGSTINVTDTTKNSGADATGASTTKLYLSANTAYNPWDTYLTSRPVPSLAAGASSTGITSVTIPLGTPAGTYYIIAAADANGDVPETNEANNTKYKAITITP